MRKMSCVFAVVLGMFFLMEGVALAKEVRVGFIATNFAAEAQARIAGRFEAMAKEKGWNVQMLNSARSTDFKAWNISAPILNASFQESAPTGITMNS